MKGGMIMEWEKDWKEQSMNKERLRIGIMPTQTLTQKHTHTQTLTQKHTHTNTHTHTHTHTNTYTKTHTTTNKQTKENKDVNFSYASLGSLFAMA
jgi:ABC-type nickel/cobalt efflux system permease component RcnA